MRAMMSCSRSHPPYSPGRRERYLHFDRAERSLLEEIFPELLRVEASGRVTLPSLVRRQLVLVQTARAASLGLRGLEGLVFGVAHVAPVPGHAHDFVIPEQQPHLAAGLARVAFELTNEVEHLARFGAAIEHVADLDERRVAASPAPAAVDQLGLAQDRDVTGRRRRARRRPPRCGRSWSGCRNRTAGAAAARAGSARPAQGQAAATAASARAQHKPRPPTRHSNDRHSSHSTIGLALQSGSSATSGGQHMSRSRDFDRGARYVAPGRGPASRRARANACARGRGNPSQDSRTWLGKTAEMEDYLKTVEMLSFDELSVGVTKPMRAHLPPGGPMKYLVWKTIQPARYGGLLGKLQERDRRVRTRQTTSTEHGAADGGEDLQGRARRRGDVGVARRRVSRTSARAPAGPLAQQGRWARQVVKAKMFHDLIADIDPNLGNWLVDPAWNLVLIDFSRCFTHRAQAQARTDARRPGLVAAHAGAHGSDARASHRPMGRQEANARRCWIGGIRCRNSIDKLVKERGETYVFMRDVGR